MTPGNAESRVGVIDLFAGPGGWDIGARSLGIDPLGIELDAATCATRAAAGLRTIKGDVSTTVIAEEAELWGLIASPPCQTFSMAGKGAGRAALDDVLLAVDLTARGLPICEFDDPRTALVVQPLRYALLHEPEWLAWEQVPTVLPVWEACADVLRAEGYNVWAGRLNAEQYGVPQTRKRAVLIASRTRAVETPQPTHSRYHPHSPDTLDMGVRPWRAWGDAIPSRMGWFFRPDDQDRAAVRGSRYPAATVKSGNGGGSSLEVGFVCEPGHRVHASNAMRLGVQQGDTASYDDVAALQTFPRGFPWQGERRQVFAQLGNAIPPLLALHILAEATGLAMGATEVAA